MLDQYDQAIHKKWTKYTTTRESESYKTEDGKWVYNHIRYPIFHYTDMHPKEKFYVYKYDMPCPCNVITYMPDICIEDTNDIYAVAIVLHSIIISCTKPQENFFNLFETYRETVVLPCASREIYLYSELELKNTPLIRVYYEEPFKYANDAFRLRNVTLTKINGKKVQLIIDIGIGVLYDVLHEISTPILVGETPPEEVITVIEDKTNGKRTAWNCWTL